jgi:hypothetical protein
MRSLFRITYCFVVLVVSIQGFGQMPATDLVAQAEISKLLFLEGNWEGKGWMFGADRAKHEFEQTEKIRLKLDGTALLIEGRGTSNGKSIHDALAIIRYNHQEKNFSFTSFLSTGMGGSFKAELKEDKLYWYPNETIRYIISINEKGQWYEIGEMNMNGSWFTFFEMTLNKK